MTLTKEQQSELAQLLGANWRRKAASALADYASGYLARFEDLLGALRVHDKWQRLRATQREGSRIWPSGGDWREEWYKDRPKPKSKRELALGVLGLGPDATFAEIKSAYRRLARAHHPDRGGDASRFKSINSAYVELTKGVK